MMIHTIIAAAGRGERFASSKNKIFSVLCGAPIVTRTALAFGSLVDNIIVVGRAEELDELKDAILPFWEKDFAKIGFVAGGESRQESVLNALREIDDPDPNSLALVHDGARPLVSKEIIERCIDSVNKCGSAVAAIPVFDTLKRVDSREVIVSSVERDKCWSMQTPQAFRLELLKKAAETAAAEQFQGTDEASIVERIAPGEVRIVLGARENIKITTPEDLSFAHQWLHGESIPDIRVGFGYDIHRFAEGRELWLGGVRFDWGRGLDGHSDADVLIHAICDALLGAAGLPDIGVLYPNTDPKWSGVSSVLFLKDVRQRLENEGFLIRNVDCTMIAEEPKISPKSDQMREIISNALQIDKIRVNVKATTQEKIGALGAGEGIACHATACIIGLR
jgi:2-C-methyl-D-erythritol 4-phosphate cytidylyltransferase/2-C-methyl-D-erythritol 2,4-cyclodiphosphate synthase